MHYESEFSLCGIDFKFADGYSLSADLNGVNLGICGGQFVFERCDLLISEHENTTGKSAATVYVNLKDFEYSVDAYGDLSFIARDGRLFKIN